MYGRVLKETKESAGGTIGESDIDKKRIKSRTPPGKLELKT